MDEKRNCPLQEIVALHRYSPWSDDWLRRCIVDAKDSCARCVPKFKYYNGFKGLDANFGRNNFGGWEGYYVVSSDK